ncbi:hypothetical protein ES703_107006 [subsurface metagenome]
MTLMRFAFYFIPNGDILQSQPLDMAEGKVRRHICIIVRGFFLKCPRALRLSPAGKIHPREHPHPHVLQRNVLQRFVFRSLDQAIAVLSLNDYVPEHDVADRAQSSLCITRLNVHKKRKDVSPVLIRIGKPCGLNIYVRKLNILIAAAILHIESNAILRISYDDVVKDTVLYGSHRPRAAFDSRIIAY